MNPFHLSQLIVVLIFCGVVLWRIFVESDVAKLNINIDPSLTAIYGPRHSRPAQFLRWQLIGGCAQKLPADWDREILAVIRTRQIPISFNLFGCTVTLIIDGRDKEVSEDIRSAGVGDSSVDSDISPNFARGEFYIQLMTPPHPRNLDSTHPMCNKGREERCGDSHSEPESII